MKTITSQPTILWYEQRTSVPVVENRRAKAMMDRTEFHLPKAPESKVNKVGLTIKAKGRKQCLWVEGPVSSIGKIVQRSSHNKEK